MSQAPDHIGWTLWRAAQTWRQEFTEAMVAAGHVWFGQARGNLMMHIGPKGLRQSDLVDRSNLTKQAVQQFVDELVADGILMRVKDETDARARWIRLTPAGETAMRDADRIKTMIEDQWRAALDGPTFDQLDAALRQLIEQRTAALPPKSKSGKKD